MSLVYGGGYQPNMFFEIIDNVLKDTQGLGIVIDGALVVNVYRRRLADLNAEGARLTEQLRREAALAAIDKVMADLPGRLDAAAQARLIDASINNLEDA